MTSTPVILLTRRSGNSSDRPFPATVMTGELALCFGGADNGLYFKDSSSAIRKVSGIHYGNTAPNSAGTGQQGNSVGEAWTDSSSTANTFYVWSGAAWEKIGAGFADNADTANTAGFATSANSANTANTANTANFATTAGSCTGQIALTFTGALPAVGVAGSAAFETALGILYISDGSSWVQIN